jgi:hypothetical protein
VKLYVAFVVQGGERSRQIAGRTIINDQAMPTSEDEIKLIEDLLERRTDADIAFITFMHELED